VRWRIGLNKRKATSHYSMRQTKHRKQVHDQLGIFLYEMSSAMIAIEYTLGVLVVRCYLADNGEFLRIYYAKLLCFWPLSSVSRVNR
jgi:hypothetical protein